MQDDTTSNGHIPRPNVKPLRNLREVDDPRVLRGIVSNPIYAGLPPYPRLVSDQAWITAATELIRTEGPEQFLVNMLYMLRASFQEVAGELAPVGLANSPEPVGGPCVVILGPDEGPEEIVLENYILCSHDQLPLILRGTEFVCVGEFLKTHLRFARVTDLLLDPDLAIVFSNGYVLPLICAGCGMPVCFEDEDKFLDQISGTTITNVQWDETDEELLLSFGDSVNPERFVLGVHLMSVQGVK